MSRKYENWLQGYIDYTAYSESPTIMHFWAGVWAIASTLRRRVWIDMGYFQWVPNVYVIFVAPPGVAQKTTTLNNAADLLREVPGIHFGPEAITWQALTMDMAAAREEILMPNPLNPEEKLFHPMSCVTISSGEFGNLFNPHDREMVDAFVSLWDSRIGTWEKKTKTQGSDKIINPCISIGACTTPAWIAGNFPEYLIGGGFTSRCVWVYAEEKRSLQAYPDEALPPEFQQMRLNLISDLKEIGNIRGQYTLSPEARAMGKEWYQEHWTEKKKELNNQRFGGYLSRKQTHIHKLAMILAAASRSELIITLEDLERARDMVTALELDMTKVFDLVGISGNAKFSNELLLHVRSYGRVTQQQLQRLCFRTMGFQEFQWALQACTAAGLIRTFTDAEGVWIIPT